MKLEDEVKVGVHDPTREGTKLGGKPHIRRISIELVARRTKACPVADPR